MHTRRRYKGLFAASSYRQGDSIASVPYAEALQTEIIDIINSICKEKEEAFKVIRAARQLATSRQTASMDEVRAIEHKFQTTCVQLRIQRRKRVRDGLTSRQIASSSSYPAGKFGGRRLSPSAYSALDDGCDGGADGDTVDVFDRSYSGYDYGLVDGVKHVKQLLAAPEHFPRKHLTYRPGQSPWDGSDFKVTLLTSLRSKLLLKYLFSAIRHESFTVISRRHAASAAARIREMKLLRSVFRALLLESMTVHYIDYVSGRTGFDYSYRKCLSPCLKSWRKRCSVSRVLKNNLDYTAMYHNGTLGKRGIDLLLSNVIRGIKLKIVKKWADSHSLIRLKVRALQAWQLAFVRKSMVRIALEAKVSAFLGVGKRRSDQFIDPRNFDEIKKQTAAAVCEQISSSLQELRYNLFHKIYDREYDRNPNPNPRAARRYNYQFGYPPSPLLSERYIGRRAVSSLPSNNIDKGFSGSGSGPQDRSRSSRAAMLRSSSPLRAVLPASPRPPSSMDFNSEPSTKPAGKGKAEYHPGQDRGSKTTVGRARSSTYLRTSAREAFRTAFNLRNILTRASEDNDDDHDDHKDDIDDHKTSAAGVVDSELYNKLLFGNEGKSRKNSLLNRAMALAVELIRVNTADDAIEGGTGDAVEYNVELNMAVRLVKKCIYYLKKFHKIREISVAFRRVRQNSLRLRKMRSLEVWLGLHKKVIIEYALCDRVFARSSLKRVLRNMYHNSIGVFVQRSLKLARISLAYRTKMSLKKWVVAYGMRRRAQWALRAHATASKRRMLDRWKSGIVTKRMVEHFKVNNLRPLIAAWRLRTRNARLLRRVFAVYEDAWAARLAYCTQFKVLSRIMTVWRVEASACRQQRIDDGKYKTALHFRGASLRARFFVAWYDLSITKSRLRSALEKKLQKERLLLKWIVVVEWQNYTRIEIMKRDSAVKKHGMGLLKKAYAIMAALRKDQVVDRPRLAAIKLLLPKYFALYREAYSNRFVARYVAPIVRKRSLLRHVSFWHGRLVVKRNIASLIQVVSAAIIKRRLRRIVAAWPGRYEFLLAEEMKKRLLSKGRGRARLVDVARPLQGRIQPAPKERRLIQPAVENRLSVQQRMHDMVAASVHRKLSLQYLQELLITVLESWLRAALRERRCRESARSLQAMKGRRLLLVGLRHWTAACSITNHRISAWVQKRDVTLAHYSSYTFGAQLPRNRKPGTNF